MASSSFKSRFLAHSRTNSTSTPESSSMNFWIFGFLLIILIFVSIVIGSIYKSGRNERFTNPPVAKNYTLQYYYMSKCRYCDEFKPEWEKIHHKISSNPNDYKFDTISYEITSNDKGIEMAQKYKVNGTPHIILVNNNNTSSYKTYEGERTLDKIITFANNNSN